MDISLNNLNWYKKAQINTPEDIMHSLDEEYCNILEEYYRVKGRRKKSPHMSWSVIPFARLKKIWQDYALNGVVRDENGMAEIKSEMLRILVRLTATNDLSGHGGHIGQEDLICDYKIPEGNNSDFYFNFLETDYGAPVSDFGLPKLWAIAQVLMRENNAERQLLLCDQMLNVIHQRGDLAALFIEGGTSSLAVLHEGHLENNPADPEAVEIWEKSRR